MSNFGLTPDSLKPHSKRNEGVAEVFSVERKLCPAVGVLAQIKGTLVGHVFR